MTSANPNVQMVEVVAQAPGELCDELVLVGGCAAGLLCTSPNAPPPRITYDVDVVAEVAGLVAYHAMEKQFSMRGFSRDMSPDAPICRWRLGEVEVDLMPTEECILGFANRWYPLAITSASPVSLPSLRNTWFLASMRLRDIQILKIHCRGWWCTTSCMRTEYAGCVSVSV